MGLTVYLKDLSCGNLCSPCSIPSCLILSLLFEKAVLVGLGDNIAPDKQIKNFHRGWLHCWLDGGHIVRVYDPGACRRVPPHTRTGWPLKALPKQRYQGTQQRNSIIPESESTASRIFAKVTTSLINVVHGISAPPPCRPANDGVAIMNAHTINAYANHFPILISLMFILYGTATIFQQDL